MSRQPDPTGLHFGNDETLESWKSLHGIANKWRRDTLRDQALRLIPDLSSEFDAIPAYEPENLAAIHINADEPIDFELPFTHDLDRDRGSDS